MQSILRRHFIQSCVLKINNSVLNVNVHNHTKYIYDIVNFMIIKRSEQMASTHHDLTKSNHMCAIVDIVGNPLIFGYNYYNIKNNNTTHAEIDAFDKLVNKMGRTRRKITVDLVVIRTNGGNSMPCDKCMKRIIEVSQRFYIRYIYFTVNEFDIGYVKFSKIDI